MHTQRKNFFCVVTQKSWKYFWGKEREREKKEKVKGKEILRKAFMTLMGF